jgi:hypothetical protein
LVGLLVIRAQAAGSVGGGTVAPGPTGAGAAKP